MELTRIKNVATRIVFPLIDAVNRPLYFTGTAWGALTNAALTAYYSDAGADWTIFNPVLTGTPTEIGTLGVWKLLLSQAEMNHDLIMIKLSADEIDEQTILINCTGANVTGIDGGATAGNNATLNLKQLNIVNSAGSAVVATSGGGNGAGIQASGNGSGHGIEGNGGSDGVGILANGGGGSGFYALGANGGAGIEARGSGTGGPGIYARAYANNAAGMQLIKHGTGKDIDADEIDAILDDTGTTLPATLADLKSAYEIDGDAVFDGTDLYLSANIRKNGTAQDATSCAAVIYNGKTGVAVHTIATGSFTEDSQYTFRATQASATVAADGIYYARFTIVLGGVSYYEDVYITAE